MNKKTPDHNDMIAATQTDCIYHDGRLAVSGYGLTDNGELAHVLLWEKINGPIPDGMRIDWTCKAKACQNIDHMYLIKDGR